MKFNDLDERMRIFETAHDVLVMPGIHCVVRLDGRGFTKLTAKLGVKKPFDDTFQTAMRDTTEALMRESGLKFLYGYHQSDEISLLLHPQEDSFNRKERKLISLLSSEASVAFTTAMGHKGTFDARVCQLPSRRDVVDYFRWRQEDATRNCLNGYCYWKLREEGLSARKASSELLRQSVSYKNELLFRRGINFNDVPAWQKRGTGMRWMQVPHLGYNPKTKQHVESTRQTLLALPNLPYGVEYTGLIQGLLETE